MTMNSNVAIIKYTTDCITCTISIKYRDYCYKFKTILNYYYVINID